MAKGVCNKYNVAKSDDAEATVSVHVYRDVNIYHPTYFGIRPDEEPPSQPNVKNGLTEDSVKLSRAHAT